MRAEDRKSRKRAYSFHFLWRLGAIFNVAHEGNGEAGSQRFVHRFHKFRDLFGENAFFNREERTGREAVNGKYDLPLV